MTVEEMETNEAEEVKQEEEEAEVEDDSIYQLKILPLTHELHQKHGLRHNDYQRYRGYCSRRIARVRKAMKLVQGEKRKYNRKEVNAENLKEAKMLLIPLMTAERAWSYAMQLKFEMNSEPRKKYHMLNRLRKATQETAKLEKLVMASEKCDARAKLEAQAYNTWMAGLYAFERGLWRPAMEALTMARTIYEKLSITLSEDEAQLYQARMNEIVPSLRFCAYNSGDEVAKKDLMKLRAGGQDVEGLINQAREEQAATLQEVEWRGRKMAVKQEKVRLFLLREQEFKDELKNVKDYEETIGAYESLLMDCKDAIQVLRDDLLEDPAFRNRQQTHEGAVTSSHFLYTYLSYMKSTKTIERNLVMIEQMKLILEGKLPEGKKPVKPQDLVRLYETIIQNLNDQPTLAGLEEDLDFKHEIEAKVVCYRAWRCYYIAQVFLGAQKWSEAMALFQRSTQHAKKARADKTGLDAENRKRIEDLSALIEGKQFMAHAHSILDSETSDEGASSGKIADLDELKKKALIDRLDTYFEDPELVKGKTQMADFPPSFTPIPCKPLFFDLAREQLTFPSLESKLASPGNPQQGGASGGWLGGWLGGWGGQPKK